MAKAAKLFGPERLCWKGNSILCVDGVLYVSISLHDYPWANPKLTDQKQTSQHGSIIKSLDHGKTWTRSMQENMARPMFPGRKFATGFFIQYGKNSSVKAHGSEQFVVCGLQRRLLEQRQHADFWPCSAQQAWQVERG